MFHVILIFNHLVAHFYFVRWEINPIEVVMR